MSIEFALKEMGYDGPTQTLAANIGETLNKHYPGHAWAVNIEHGVVNVYNLSLSGKWGFRIKQTDLDIDYGKQFVRAGGEILERYKIQRGALNLDIVNSLQRDFTGEPIADKG